MSYEKVKIVGISQITKKTDGTIHNFLQVEVLQSHDIYLNDDALKLIPQYERLKGKEVLLPVNWQEYKGKPSLNLQSDYKPILIPSS